MSHFQAVIVQVLQSDWTRALAVLIVLDVVSGVAAGLKAGQFDVRRLADFLRTSVLPGLLVLVVLVGAQIVAPGEAWLGPASVGAYGLLVASLLASIATNLKEAGLPIPLPGQG